MSARTWSYDGSLPALFLLLGRAIEAGRAPELVKVSPPLSRGGAARGAGSGELFGPEIEEPEFRFEAGDETGCEAAKLGILGLSRRLYAAVLNAWMSEEAVEADLAAVALDCAKRGEVALGDYGRPSLSRLAACVRRVSHEAHKLEGFARFSPNKEGVFVACLEPDHNVLPALASFFLGRFGEEGFALLDLRREYGIIRRPEADSLFVDNPGPEPLGRLLEGGSESPFDYLIGEEFSACLPEAGENEEAELWRLYFRTVENKSRHNPGLQRCLMPRRYWKNLTEFGAR